VESTSESEIERRSERHEVYWVGLMVHERGKVQPTLIENASPNGCRLRFTEPPGASVVPGSRIQLLALVDNLPRVLHEDATVCWVGERSLGLRF